MFDELRLSEGGKGGVLGTNPVSQFVDIHKFGCAV
jgi:hypothetical protein